MTQIRARVIATKIEERYLAPGDLFSDKGPEFWNRVMFGNVPAVTVTIRTNDMETESDPNAMVYRLTVALENDNVQERDHHVMQPEFSPFSPPGIEYADYIRRQK
jgi:hypothetical protein